MPACNRARRIGQVVRILTPWPGTPNIPAEFFNEATGPTKIGVITEVKYSQSLPAQYVVKTADGETHTLARNQFATSAVIALKAPLRTKLLRTAPTPAPATAPQQKQRQHQGRPRRRGNFADIARLKEASK